MTTVGSQVGGAIRERRTRSGMSQAGLASALRERGLTLHSTAICRIENGSRDLRLTETAVIADALGTNVAGLLGEMSVSASEAYAEGYRAAISKSIDLLRTEENRNV